MLGSAGKGGILLSCTVNALYRTCATWPASLNTSDMLRCRDSPAVAAAAVQQRLKFRGSFQAHLHQADKVGAARALRLDERMYQGQQVSCQRLLQQLCNSTAAS